MLFENILFIVFLNFLIACLLSFVFLFIFHLQSSSNFWVLAIVSLIGANIGTFIGIILQINNLTFPVLVIYYALPFLISLLFTIIYIFLDHY